MRRASVAGFTAALLVSALLAPTLAGAKGTAKPSGLASVKYIYHGLTVQPPHKRAGKGKIKEALFTQYFLQTHKAQRASLRFKDGTILHMNQYTDAVLQSPHITRVKKGEVDEVLMPGTNHQVSTATAVATAIGTNFLVKAVKGGAYFIVVHGAVHVANAKGSQTVTTNEESLVVKGHPPQPPVHVDAQSLANWTKGMAPSNLPENQALAANGAKVVDFSSQYRSAVEGNFWDATYINDGSLDYGWESASGQTTNQWVKIKLAGGKTRTISQFLIDPAATHSDPASADLKDFRILVSTTGTADSDFTQVLQGTCQQKNALQRFKLSAPVRARYIELVAVDNYGSPDWTSVAEVEAVGK
jgi:hypothetical protein